LIATIRATTLTTSSRLNSFCAINGGSQVANAQTEEDAAKHEHYPAIAEREQQESEDLNGEVDGCHYATVMVSNPTIPRMSARQRRIRSPG